MNKEQIKLMKGEAIVQWFPSRVRGVGVKLG